MGKLDGKLWSTMVVLIQFRFTVAQITSGEDAQGFRYVKFNQHLLLDENWCTDS